MTTEIDMKQFIDPDCQKCSGLGFQRRGNFKETCDCIIGNWRQYSAVQDGGPGLYYTPDHIVNPATGSGVFLAHAAGIIGNPPWLVSGVTP